jgi:hypothetical protein
MLLQVSWDFYNAAKHGFLQLQQQVEQLDVQLPERRDGWSWQQWGAFLSDPLPYSKAEVQGAIRQLRLANHGTKAELVLKVLSAFGLKTPSTASPKLLRALALECTDPLCRGLACGELYSAREALLLWPSPLRKQSLGAGSGLTYDQVNNAQSAAAWRKLLVSVGVESKAQLLELKSSAEAARAKLVEEEKQRQQEQSCGPYLGF